MTREDAEEFYRAFLADVQRFETCLNRVITEWVNSCEHYLTNEKMNRIAWMGQASACVCSGIPSKYRGGYNLLTEDQQKTADETALKYINIWMIKNGYPELTMEQIQSKTEANIY